MSGESRRGLGGLNVFSDLYVGGYHSYRMSGLPDEFPFTASFQGKSAAPLIFITFCNFMWEQYQRNGSPVI